MTTNTNHEDEIYRGKRFRRQAFVTVVLCLIGLGGLLGTLYYLNLQPIYTIDPEAVHATCTHAECQIPHPGDVNKYVGMGGGVLCVFYLAYCCLVGFFVLLEPWNN